MRLLRSAIGVSCAMLSLASAGCMSGSSRRDDAYPFLAGSKTGLSQSLYSTSKPIAESSTGPNGSSSNIAPVTYAEELGSSRKPVVTPAADLQPVGSNIPTDDVRGTIDNDVSASDLPTAADPFEIHGAALVEGGAAPLSIDDFQQLAATNNPTLRGLSATTQKAAGYRDQVSQRSNPSIGYQAMQLADQGTDQHTLFVEREFVTANKLGLNRRVLNETLRAQLYTLQAQRIRVATDVRVRFLRALETQQQVRLLSEFVPVVEQGLEIATARMDALEGSRVDVLQSKLQLNEVKLALQQARQSATAAWQELVTVAGVPHLQPTALSGDLTSFAAATPQAPQDLDTLIQPILQSSPQYHAAQARVQQARALIARHCVQTVPNLTMQLAAGVDNATDSGMINFQVTAPIATSNRNEGNIAAARAELCKAMAEVQRVENSIQARLAGIVNEFNSALAAVRQYGTEMLPDASEALSLADTAYRAGETDFLQVLLARRIFFDTNLKNLVAQSQLAQADAKIEGYALTGALDAIDDRSGDDMLRGLTFSQQ